MSTDPQTVLQLVEHYAAARVRAEHFHREAVLGSTASYEPHSAALQEADRVFAQITAVITELGR